MDRKQKSIGFVPTKLFLFFFSPYVFFFLVPFFCFHFCTTMHKKNNTIYNIDLHKLIEVSIIGKKKRRSIGSDSEQSKTNRKFPCGAFFEFDTLGIVLLCFAQISISSIRYVDMSLSQSAQKEEESGREFFFFLMNLSKMKSIISYRENNQFKINKILIHFFSFTSDGGEEKQTQNFSRRDRLQCWKYEIEIDAIPFGKSFINQIFFFQINRKNRIRLILVVSFFVSMMNRCLD